jgi:hypothetical protein
LDTLSEKPKARKNNTNAMKHFYLLIVAAALIPACDKEEISLSKKIVEFFFKYLAMFFFIT